MNSAGMAPFIALENVPLETNTLEREKHCTETSVNDEKCNTVRNDTLQAFMIY